MNDIERVMQKIEVTQGDWDGKCSCTECYWNMNHPTKRPDDKQCVSESLADTRMIPNTVECPSYWSFTEACGVSKGGEMPETRDWQEDWNRLNGIRAIHSVNGFLRAQRYWMQEYKKKSELYDELKEQLARINCDYHSLKNKFLNMREECGAEKKRADTAELIIEGLQSEEWQKTCQYCEGTKAKIEMYRNGFNGLKEREKELIEIIKSLGGEDKL